MRNKQTIYSKFILITCLLILNSFALFAEGDGYGENPGGAGGDTIIVETPEEFKSYAGLQEPYVIFIKDTIDVGSEVRIASYKTISGLNTNSTVIGNMSIKSGTNNVVVKNLNITNPMNDGITIRNAQYVYVTNCTVYDCADGCIDITVESDFVTVSHCRFFYENVTFHKFVNLIGASDDNLTDRGKLHVTMHNNWWDTGCTSRMPRVRFGYVHIYNNYFNCEGNNYCNRAGKEGHIFSERNYFEGVRDPLTVEDEGVAKSIGNIYADCTGTIYAGNDDVFTPSYSYNALDAEEIKENIVANAGNTKTEAAPTTGKKETIIHWPDQNDIIFGTPLSEVQLNATAEGNTSAPIYSHGIGAQLEEGYNTLTATFPEDENYKAASKTINIKVNYIYYSLSVLKVDASNPDLVVVSPEGKKIGGELKFPKGTVVTLVANSNLLSTFDHWSNGETNDTISISMDGDTEITAYYNQLDYIVAWDLYEDININRPADYYSANENQSSVLNLKNTSGINTTWASYPGETKLLGKNAAMIRRSKYSAGNYFFEIEFDASNFENIQVSASMLGILTYYKIQNVEYSIDGTNYMKIGDYTLEQDSLWYSETFALPDDANGKSSITVRFKADKSSTLTTDGNIGTSISEIIVLGDLRNPTSITENLTNKKIIEQQYFTLDGKRIAAPTKGINLLITRYEDGSISTKKIFCQKIN